MAKTTQMPLIMAAAIVCLIMPALAAGIGGGRGGYGFNMATGASVYDNQWQPLEDSHKAVEERSRGYRSSSSSSGLDAMFNGLSHLSGLGHIAAHNGYASVAPTHTEALALASNKQEIPIYEEQHEDAAVAAVAATANDYGGGSGSGSGSGSYSPSGVDSGNAEQHSSQGHHPTIYDYPAAAAGAALGSHGAHGYLPAFGGAEQNAIQHFGHGAGAGVGIGEGGEQGQYQHQAGPHYAYDKISVGNYINHYDQNGDGFESYRQHQAEEQQQHQQHQQLEHGSSYFSPHEGQSHASGGSGPGGSGASDYEDHADGDDSNGGNFLAESSSHGHDGVQAHSHQSHHHVDIINYVPVKHVKKEHVPVEKAVKIPVSHAVIIPIKKPVPIHIPITKQVQVPIEKELKVPVERLVPVPIEKHIPVPVEKKVPYTVVKYVPIKVPKPFPVKVPVFKTVLHKVKSWW